MDTPTKGKEFWDRVYARALVYRLSIKQVAEACGISYQVMLNWKSKGRLPSSEHLPALAAALGMSVDEILGCLHGPAAYPDEVRNLADKLCSLTPEEFAYAKISIEGIWKKHCTDIENQRGNS